MNDIILYELYANNDTIIKIMNYLDTYQQKIMLLRSVTKYLRHYIDK